MNPLKLPLFIPKPWVCEVFHTPKHEATKAPLKRSRALKETLYFDTHEEAQALAKKKSHNFETAIYEGIVRESNPKDHAQQRWEQIQEALQQTLKATIKAEENILVYDTETYGEVCLANFFEGAQETLDDLQASEETPMSMGWVGSDGRP